MMHVSCGAVYGNGQMIAVPGTIWVKLDLVYNIPNLEYIDSLFAAVGVSGGKD